MKAHACHLNTWEVEAGGQETKVTLGHIVNSRSARDP